MPLTTPRAMLRSKVAIGEHRSYRGETPTLKCCLKQCSAVMPATTIDRRIRRQGGNPYHLTEAATKRQQKHHGNIEGTAAGGAEEPQSQRKKNSTTRRQAT